jgi:hypothetical protein
MAYNIYKSDGTTVSIPDNVIDQTYNEPNANGAGKGLGTQLVGRNAIDYGAPIAQNFLQQRENFCGTVLPSDTTALQGQLWFNKASATDGTLYVRITSNVSGGLANWRKIPTINPTTPSDGDIQVVGSVISIWANGAWQQVFPAIYS